MSEENADDSQKGKKHNKREATGQFAPKIEPKPPERSQPSDSEYTKINSRLAKQLNLTDKLADYQTQYNPRELYKMLDFMADNSGKSEGAQQKGQGLPPNEKAAPISPATEKYELPGIQIDKPNLSKQNFSVHYKIPFKDVLGKKNK